jgi:hypothetical protein
MREQEIKRIIVGFVVVALQILFIYLGFANYEIREPKKASMVYQESYERKNAHQFIHDGKAHIDSVIEDGVVYSHKENDLITLRSTNGKVITMNNCIGACLVKTEKISKQYSTTEMSEYAINAYKELYNYLHEQYKTIGEKTNIKTCCLF